MSQRPRITITQSQRLQLNLGLHAAIRLLRADAAGLTRYLEEAAAENPALGLDPPPLPPPGDWLPRWTRAFAPALANADDIQQPAAGPSLMAHVLSAIDRRMTAPQDRRIALALAEALEPSGWLGQSVTSIAAALRVRVREVEAVLKRLQEIDPAGLFARDLAECLTLQAQEDGTHDPIMAVVLQNLDLLSRGDLARLATLARTTPPEIALRLKQIRTLNPKPGTAFDDLAAPSPREPDLTARQTAAGWEVALNRASLPSLRIIDPGAGAGSMAAAKSVQRLVEARNSTLLRVGREILQRQSLALTAGPRALVPMTMADIAQALDLHESTVSRVVAGTAVDTPLGTWWLRRLFSSGFDSDTEGAGPVSAAALRDHLSRAVAAEDKSAPLSDAALVESLSATGVTLARRTVAKYRDMLRIPPAHRRRLR